MVSEAAEGCLLVEALIVFVSCHVQIVPGGYRGRKFSTPNDNLRGNVLQIPSLNRYGER